MAQMCETLRENTQEIAQVFTEKCSALADELYPACTVSAAFASDRQAANKKNN